MNAGRGDPGRGDPGSSESHSIERIYLTMSAPDPSRTALFCLLLVTITATATPAQAKSRYTVEPLEEAVPKEVSKEVRASVEPIALRVLDRKKKPFADLWLRRKLAPQKPNKEPGIVYGHIPEGSLLGVIRIHARGSDFRGDRVKAGVFTMRNAIQPQDGDHLGVSDSRDFILLSPVKVDTKTKSLPTKAVIKLSVQASGRKHPSILYLIKLYDKAKKLPRIVEEEDLEYWVLDCEIRNAPTPKTKKAAPAKSSAAGKSPAKPSAAEKSPARAKPLRLSIVIEGEAEDV
jgi:hypothetical protein